MPQATQPDTMTRGASKRHTLTVESAEAAAAWVQAVREAQRGQRALGRLLLERLAESPSAARPEQTPRLGLCGARS